MVLATVTCQFQTHSQPTRRLAYTVKTKICHTKIESQPIIIPTFHVVHGDGMYFFMTVRSIQRYGWRIKNSDNCTYLPAPIDRVAISAI